MPSQDFGNDFHFQAAPHGANPHAELQELREELKALRAELRELRAALRQRRR